MFYESDIPWFGVFANSMIWVCIVSGVGFAAWVAYNMIASKRKDREEIRRITEGLETEFRPIANHKANKTTLSPVPQDVKEVVAVPERESMPVTGEGNGKIKSKSPFAPGQGKRRKLTSGS